MEWLCKLQLIIHGLPWVLAGTLENLLFEDLKEAVESEGKLGPSGWTPAHPSLSLRPYLAETEEVQAPKPS